MENITNNKDVDAVVGYGQFTVQIRERFQKNYWEERGQMFQYAQGLMNIFGLIAGFGFTAFGYIKSPISFFAGEILVVASILYLVYKVKEHVAGQPMSTEKQMNIYTEKARQIKTALTQKDGGAITALAKEFNEGVNDVSISPPVEIAKTINDSLELSFWCGTLGIALVLLSFVVCL